MHPSLDQVDHRPWPIPHSAWTWRQSWNELLFVHFRVETKSIANFVPKNLKIQEFGGSSWVGIVPFEMNGVMRRPLPNLPWFSNFLELNVRLYVEYEGKPGVWFLSLDATNPLVVWGGNVFFNLPYKNARITSVRDGEHTQYHSIRTSKLEPAEFAVRFRASSEVFFAKPGSLEHFLTERYCFYALGPRGIYRADVHHRPWPLQMADGLILRNTLTARLGVDEKASPLFHCSKGVDVVSWMPVQD